LTRLHDHEGPGDDCTLNRRRRPSLLNEDQAILTELNFIVGLPNISNFPEILRSLVPAPSFGAVPTVAPGGDDEIGPRRLNIFCEAE
jgi:hypothetical protein